MRFRTPHRGSSAGIWGHLEPVAHRSTGQAPTDQRQSRSGACRGLSLRRRASGTEHQEQAIRNRPSGTGHQDHRRTLIARSTAAQSFCPLVRRRNRDAAESHGRASSVPQRDLPMDLEPIRPRATGSWCFGQQDPNRAKRRPRSAPLAESLPLAVPPARPATQWPRPTRIWAPQRPGATP